MRDIFSAVFEQGSDTIKVFEKDHAKGNKVYLGTLDLARNYNYEGRYVFCLDAEHIANRHQSKPFHIPSKVLREIADYGTQPKDRPVIFYLDAVGVRHSDKSS